MNISLFLKHQVLILFVMFSLKAVSSLSGGTRVLKNMLLQRLQFLKCDDPSLVPTRAPISVEPSVPTTPAPTVSPTPAPTPAPTASPTSTPSEAPTASPTSTPSEAPTESLISF